MIGGRTLGCLATAAIVAGLLLPATARGASSAGAPAAYSASVTSGGAAPAKPVSGGCSIGSTILNTVNPFSHCNPAHRTFVNLTVVNLSVANRNS